MINKGGKRGIVLSDLRKTVSCILKGVVVASAAIGVILSALASASTFMGCGWWIISLFLLVYLVGRVYLALLNHMILILF